MSVVEEQPQHMTALARANVIRFERRRVKREIAAGNRRTLLDAILFPSPELETMPVLDLLMAQRKWGLARAKRLLKAARVHESRSVGSGRRGLTDRQRELIADLVGRV